MVNRLEGENGRLSTLLLAEWPAFYLGSVAPDLQAVCDLPREATHFYPMPPSPEDKAWPRMMAEYPELANARHLPADQAVFVAAYCAHLMLDLVWFWQVMLPYFAEPPNMGDLRERFLVHNVLLTWLDEQARMALPDTAVTTLAQAEPDHWLPFATDADIRQWRDRLVVQLQPGATTETVATYARRMRMSPSEYEAMLHDATWMETHLFARVPVDKVQARLETAVSDSIHLIRDYLRC